MPSTPTDRLHHHMDRIGANAAVHQDPAAKFQYSMLRTFIDILQAALDDEHVPPGSAAGVIDRVIYGCTPNPAVSEYRLAQAQARVEQLRAQQRHRHLSFECRVHQTRLGGCKCMHVDGDEVEVQVIDCTPTCPGATQ